MNKSQKILVSVLLLSCILTAIPMNMSFAQSRKTIEVAKNKNLLLPDGRQFIVIPSSSKNNENLLILSTHPKNPKSEEEYFQQLITVTTTQFLENYRPTDIESTCITVLPETRKGLTDIGLDVFALCMPHSALKQVDKFDFTDIDKKNPKVARKFYEAASIGILKGPKGPIAHDDQLTMRFRSLLGKFHYGFPSGVHVDIAAWERGDNTNASSTTEKADNRQVGQNWEIKYHTDWSSGRDRTVVVTCGNGTSKHIREDLNTPTNPFWIGGGGVHTEAFKTLDEAAQHACQ